MCVLIGNTVKTQFADYPCATREEAETLFMTLRDREEGRGESGGAASEGTPVMIRAAARAAQNA